MTSTHNQILIVLRTVIGISSDDYVIGVSLSEPHIDHDNGPRRGESNVTENMPIQLIHAVHVHVQQTATPTVVQWSANRSSSAGLPTKERDGEAWAILGTSI